MKYLVGLVTVEVVEGTTWCPLTVTAQPLDLHIFPWLPGPWTLEPGPGRVFSNSIKLMLERQKFTLYQHETLLEKAKITPNQQDMLLGRKKSTL